MRSTTRPEDLAAAVLRELVSSGRRLLAAESVLVAAGPPGRLTVRVAAGAEPAAVHSPVAESAPGPDGVLVPVRVTASSTGGIALAPAQPGSDAYATAGSASGGRVLLVVAGTTPSPPDEHVVRHLLDTAAAVVSAERSAVFGTIRESLHEREEERRRWARELHDDTLQQLGALQVLLTSALAGAPQTDPRCTGLVDAVRLATELVAGQIGNLRQLITELRPAALDDLGLTPPLQALARRTEQLSGIRVTVHASLRYADGIVGTRLMPDVELAVYRVVQEALTNIRRHSTATRATVTVVEDDDTVVAEISDDGQGFDPDRAAGFGLSGMRERAELAQGTLEVLPAGTDGRGTTVRLVVPARHR
jgi:two-component system, NarL family, sensor histidine kinase DevS